MNRVSSAFVFRSVARRTGRVASSAERASRRLRQFAVDRQTDGAGVQTVRKVGGLDRRKSGRIQRHGRPYDQRWEVRLQATATRGSYIEYILPDV